MEALRPASRVAGTTAYRVPRHPAPVDLDLAATRARCPTPPRWEPSRALRCFGGTPTQRRCRPALLLALG